MLAFALSERRSTITGVVVCQRRKPTTVTSDTNKTIPTVNDANCGNESSQLRENHDFCRGVSLITGSTGSALDISASMTFRIPNQRALSFGGASYSPRCALQ